MPNHDDDQLNLWNAQTTFVKQVTDPPTQVYHPPGFNWVAEDEEFNMDRALDRTVYGSPWRTCEYKPPACTQPEFIINSKFVANFPYEERIICQIFEDMILLIQGMPAEYLGIYVPDLVGLEMEEDEDDEDEDKDEDEDDDDGVLLPTHLPRNMLCACGPGR